MKPCVFSGSVIEVGRWAVLVRFEELTSPERPEEVAELRLKYVLPDDRKGLCYGQRFLWSISKAGSKVVSRIRFFPPPCWTEEEIEDVNQRGMEMYSWLCGLTDTA